MYVCMYVRANYLGSSRVISIISMYLGSSSFR